MSPLTRIRNGKEIEIRILPESAYMENIQGNVYHQRAIEKQKAKRNSVEFWEKELAKLKAKNKYYKGKVTL
ncbi:MAG: hypothetical protein Q8934_10910 [Bacillota bacterium]|nr:hypothetical protein [Bacillota bacterium]